MPSRETPPVSTGGAIVTIVVTVFAMSFADAVVKLVSTEMPLWQIYAVRSLVAIPILTAILALGRQPVALRPGSGGWAALRSLLLAFMYIAIYAGVPVLSLPVIAAALYTGPLFIALFAALLLGEPVGARRWAAIGLGFLGVLAILRPGTEAFTPLALVPVAAALLYALAAIVTRAKCAEDSPLVLALALNYALLAVGAAATGALLALPPVPWDYPFLLGPWIPMGGREWGVILVLGLLIVGIGVGLAKAYQSAAPALIATFDYSYLLFAAFWGYVLFAERPDAPTLLGMVMIAAAGALAVRPGRRPIRAPVSRLERGAL